MIKFIVMLLLSFNALAQVNVVNDFTATATTSSLEQLAQNQYRALLYIENKGPDEAYIKFDSAHSGSEGITLSSGESLNLAPAPINSVYVKSATTSSIIIVEGQK